MTAPNWLGGAVVVEVGVGMAGFVVAVDVGVPGTGSGDCCTGVAVTVGGWFGGTVAVGVGGAGG